MRYHSGMISKALQHVSVELDQPIPCPIIQANMYVTEIQNLISYIPILLDKFLVEHFGEFTVCRIWRIEYWRMV